MEKKHAEQKRLSVWAVTKYTCLGVPISVKRLDRPWKETLTPRLPLFFPLLVAFLYIMAGTAFGLLSRADEEYSQTFTDVVSSMFVVSFMTVCCLILFNVVLLGWCFLILWIFKRITEKETQVTHGAQRVTYFAAVFQPLTIFIPFVIFWQYGGRPFGLAINSVLLLVLLIACIIRVMAVFQGMCREAGGNIWIGFLSIIPCVDVWFGLSFLTFILYAVIVATIEISGY